MAVLEDFRLVSVSPELQPFPPSPMDEACASFGTHDSRMQCLPTRPLRSRPGPRQSQHRHPPKPGARTTTGLVRRVYEEGPCRIKRHWAAYVPFGGRNPTFTGSLAMLLAIRRASSSVSTPAIVAASFVSRE